MEETLNFQQIKDEFIASVKDNLENFSLYFCKIIEQHEYYKFAINDTAIISEIVTEITFQLTNRIFKSYEEVNDLNTVCVFKIDDPLISTQIVPYINFTEHSSDSNLDLKESSFNYYTIMSQENSKIQLIRIKKPYHTLKKKWFFNRDSENNTILKSIDNLYLIDSTVDLIIWNNLVFVISQKGESILDLSTKIAAQRDELYSELEKIDFMTNFEQFQKGTTRNSKCVLSYNPEILKLRTINPQKFKEDAEAAGLHFNNNKIVTDTKDDSIALLHYLCNKRIGRPTLNQIIDCDNPRIL